MEDRCEFHSLRREGRDEAREQPLLLDAVLPRLKEHARAHGRSVIVGPWRQDANG